MKSYTINIYIYMVIFHKPWNFRIPGWLNGKDDRGRPLARLELLGRGVSFLRSKDLENQLRDTTKHFEEFWRGVGCVENRRSLIHLRWEIHGNLESQKLMVGQWLGKWYTSYRGSVMEGYLCELPELKIFFSGGGIAKPRKVVVLKSLEDVPAS